MIDTFFELQTSRLLMETPIEQQIRRGRFGRPGVTPRGEDRRDLPVEEYPVHLSTWNPIKDGYRRLRMLYE